MAIAGYKLRVNGGSHVNTVIDVGLVYEYLLTGLAGSTLYEVEIQSYDEVGNESEWSTAVSATTDEPPEMSMIIDADGNAILDNAGNAITVLV